MSTRENGNKTGKSSKRDERLKAALRENLRRRKAQERARGASATVDAPEKPVVVPQDDKIR